jgi:hypothetical protein
MHSFKYTNIFDLIISMFQYHFMSCYHIFDLVSQMPHFFDFFQSSTYWDIWFFYQKNPPMSCPPPKKPTGNSLVVQWMAPSRLLQGSTCQWTTASSHSKAQALFVSHDSISKHDLISPWLSSWSASINPLWCCGPKNHLSCPY